MAIRKPLVTILGQVQELPAGDSIPSVAAPSPLIGNFSGITGTSIGTSRFYPVASVVLTKIEAWAGAAVPSATIITILKNGTSIGSITIPYGSLLATPVTVSVAFASTDYITLNLASTGAIDVLLRLTF